MTFRPPLNCILRLVLALALGLLPLAGSHAAMAGCDPVAAAPASEQHASGHADLHGASAAAHKHAAYGTAGHEGAAPHANGVQGEKAPATGGAHKACCIANCPACLWQATAAPLLPVPSPQAVLEPPLEPPVPNGHAPSPPLDPPRRPV